MQIFLCQNLRMSFFLCNFASQKKNTMPITKQHHSQKIKDKEQGIIEITVIPNRELEAQLLWFGNDVEVLQPETLRQQIAEKIANMHDLYK